MSSVRNRREPVFKRFIQGQKRRKGFPFKLFHTFILFHFFLKFKDILANFSNRHSSGYIYIYIYEYIDKGLFPDWSALDAETLHRVIMKCCIKNHCDNCQSWYLPINQSFCYVCVSGGDMTAGSTLFVDKDKASDKAMDSSIALMKKRFYRGREICISSHVSLL